MFGFEHIDPAQAAQFLNPHHHNRKRFASVEHNNLTWARRKLPSPGAGNYVFTSFALPEYSPIGPSTVNAMQFRSLCPTVYARQAVPVVGLGGLQTGQVISGPLINSNTGTIV